MNLNFLPEKVLFAIKNIDINEVYDIRLRVNNVVTINYGGINCFLAENGTTFNYQSAIKTNNLDIERLINSITEYSIYSKSDSIKNGYITTNDGIRVGLSGHCVFENGQVVTIKDITSLNIRLPHEIIGASKEVCKNIFKNDIKSTLIISPPGYGKTTILKDLIRVLSEDVKNNLLVIDERGELKVNNYRCDYIRYSNKLYAFNYGIRSMSPNIIIADELSEREDFIFCDRAVNSGIKVIATCHGSSLQEVKNKDYYKDGIFNVYVVLESKKERGRIKEIIYND